MEHHELQFSLKENIEMDEILIIVWILLVKQI